MTDKIDDGGPAFPDGQMFNGIAIHPGMSLRDAAALAALSGLLAHASGEDPHESPEMAWALADKWLAARAKGGGK